MNQRPLQIVSAALGMVPVVTGLVQLMGIDDPLYASLHMPRDATLDSNMRFLAGVWLGLGVANLWLVPRIARETVLFRCLWLMIFLGGIGRLLSMASVGLPLLPFVGFTALEVVCAPIFVVWQAKVAKSGIAAHT